MNNVATYCTCCVDFFVFSASQSKIKTWEMGWNEELNVISINRYTELTQSVQVCSLIWYDTK